MVRAVPLILGLPIPNPLDYFAEKLKDAYQLLVSFFEHVLVNPPRVHYSSALDYLYGNAVGLAGYIAVTVTVLLTCIAMFKVNRFFSVAEGIAISLFITAMAPFWFFLIDRCISVGDKLSKFAAFYHPHMGDHRTLLGIVVDNGNPLLIVSAFMPTGILGSIAMIVVLVYELFNAILKFAGLLALAVRPIGPRAAAMCDALLGVGTVTTMTGRPLMIIIITLARWFGDHTMGGSQTAVVVFTIAGLSGALVSQFFLIKQSYRVVVKVTGNTSSIIKGKVQSTIKQPGGANPQAINGRRQAAMKPVPVVMATPQRTSTQKARGYVSNEVKTQAKKVIVRKLAAAGVGAATGGTGYVAAEAAARAASRNGSKRPPTT